MFVVQTFDGKAFDGLFVVLNDQLARRPIDDHGHRLALQRALGIVGPIIDASGPSAFYASPVAAIVNGDEPGVRIKAPIIALDKGILVLLS